MDSPEKWAVNTNYPLARSSVSSSSYCPGRGKSETRAVPGKALCGPAVSDSTGAATGPFDKNGW